MGIFYGIRKPTRPPIERFLEKIEIDNKGCWLWKGCIATTGYGKLGGVRKDGVSLAHRFSWKHFNGNIPNNICVLHRCDVRNCVNPKHLFLGTKKENTKDMMQKGRGTIGENHPKAKLTNEAVKQIRELEFTNTGSELARRFGVSVSLISSVQQRKVWRHLP